MSLWQYFLTGTLSVSAKPPRPLSTVQMCNVTASHSSATNFHFLCKCSVDCDQGFIFPLPVHSSSCMGLSPDTAPTPLASLIIQIQHCHIVAFSLKKCCRGKSYNRVENSLGLYRKTCNKRTSYKCATDREQEDCWKRMNVEMNKESSSSEMRESPKEMGESMKLRGKKEDGSTETLC